jgi:hypothetical protein
MKIAITVGRYGWARLVPGGEEVDLELDADPGARGAVTLPEHSCDRPILVVTSPDHHEVAVVLGGDRRPVLQQRGEDVDLELGGERGAGAGEAAREDAPVRPILRARPGDDEVAVAILGDRRLGLGVVRVGVDLELGADRVAGRGEAPREDAVARVVLNRALPYDDETAAGVDGDRGGGLGRRGEQVDAELGAEGSAGAREASSEHAQVLAVLSVARPGHDEVAVAVGVERGLRLVVSGVAVDLELGPDAEELPRGG